MFVARLQTLASAHDLLSLESWDRVPLGDLVSRALAPFQESHHQCMLIDGPNDIRLDAKKSVLLAMGLHELATNAVKYGALSKGNGQVHVVWDRLPESLGNGVRLCWKESGGPAVEPPEHKGFGSRLLERAFDGDLGWSSIRKAYLVRLTSRSRSIPR